MSNFVHLHTHDAYGSLLDAILRPEELAQFAKEHGQAAIATTNHGYMSSYVDFVKSAKAEGIKPILGCEVYEVDNMYAKSFSKLNKDKRYHLVLLAKTQEGFHNLLQIVSAGCTEGFYMKPRIDFNYIKSHDLGKGILCLTACQAGRLSQILDSDDEDKTDQAKDFWNTITGLFDYCAVEIQSHDTESQRRCNKELYNFAKRYDLPYVVTCDAHMKDESQFDVHAAFIAIGKDQEAGEIYKDCYLQTEDDVHRILDDQLTREVVDKAIDETAHIADMIDDIDIGLTDANIMPEIAIGEGFEDNESYLKYLVFKTFDEKFGHLSDEEKQARTDRLNSELDVLFKLRYTDYFIMLYMLANEAKKREIPMGYSRGSGANCLCLYMLGVTQIDSVRWDLDFSRFANLGRHSLADFDFDVSRRRRKEFIQISEDLFGKSNVAGIATFNTLSTKVAIKDIGKVLNEDKNSPYYQQIPYSLREDVAKMIPTITTLNDLGEDVEKDALLKDVLSKNDDLDGLYDKFPLWFEYVIELEGLPKSLGRHAAGTLITPEPITNYCPLCLDTDGNVMVQLEMHNAMDDLGLTKMDYLGLETLDIIDDTLKMVGITWKDIDIEHLDLNDQRVYKEVYGSGNTLGVFQMESAEAKDMCIKAEANNIEDIIAINASNRPGTKDNFPTYCENKKHPENATVLHPDLKKIFANTHYILLYQEQALKLFRYADFPEEEVDNARRAIGKKKKDVMVKLKRDFEENLLNDKGWTQEQTDEIWELLLKQSGYSFNKGHSTAYGLLSYLTAYLKVHYTKYYMAACLTANSENLAKLSILIGECKRLGLQVFPPDVNKSQKEFAASSDEDTIWFGLKGVKGLGDNVIDILISGRPYESFNDFIERFGKDNRIAAITLIKAGALPVKDKTKALKKFGMALYQPCQFKEVTQLPSYIKLNDIYGIDCNNYIIECDLLGGHPVYDGAAMLKDYNALRHYQYLENEKKRKDKFMQDFTNKYIDNPTMWEFDTLSTFVTYDPIKDMSNKYIQRKFDEVANGDKVVVIGIITNVKTKKNKGGKQFAYLDLYTATGNIEAIVFASVYAKYVSLIKRGNAVAVLGNKEGTQLNVCSLKTLEQWQKDKRIRKEVIA